jgi:hypothetical protein
MRDTIDMALEAGFCHDVNNGIYLSAPMHIKALVDLVRADEREQGQKWFDAVTAQHKQLILAEREACAKVCDELHPGLATKRAAEIIRARGTHD